MNTSIKIILSIAFVSILFGCSKKGSIELPEYPGPLVLADWGIWIDLTVDRHGGLWLANEQVTHAELLRRVRRAGPDYSLLIEADRRCKIEKIGLLINSLRESAVAVANFSYVGKDDSRVYHQLGINIHAPGADDERLTISISQNNCQISGQDIETKELLKSQLGVVNATNPGRKICLRLTNDCRLQNLTDIIWLCRVVGLRNIYFEQESTTSPVTE